MRYFLFRRFYISRSLRFNALLSPLNFCCYVTFNFFFLSYTFSNNFWLVYNFITILIFPHAVLLRKCRVFLLKFSIAHYFLLFFFFLVWDFEIYLRSQQLLEFAPISYCKKKIACLSIWIAEALRFSMYDLLHQLTRIRRRRFPNNIPRQMKKSNRSGICVSWPQYAGSTVDIVVSHIYFRSNWI